MDDVKERSREDRDLAGLTAIQNNIPLVARAMGLTERQVRKMTRDALTPGRDVSE